VTRYLDHLQKKAAEGRQRREEEAHITKRHGGLPLERRQDCRRRSVYECDFASATNVAGRWPGGTRSRHREFACARRTAMDISTKPALERVARVLAGQQISANGSGDEESASDIVDQAWRDRLDDARAVLKTLREPDQRMAAAGDPAVWEKMVLAALDVA
jgi:hypothetical protein